MHWPSTPGPSASMCFGWFSYPGWTVFSTCAPVNAERQLSPNLLCIPHFLAHECIELARCQTVGRNLTSMAYCLIVDDSRVVRAVARRILEELKFEVGEAENGQVALDRCAADMPDLVMLDLNMPVLDGISFLRELRARPNGDHPKVVFCTADSNLPSIEKAIEAGADEYIMKPFDQEIVRSKLIEAGII